MSVLPERLPSGSSWLDVGTGSAMVPLSRPGLAQSIVGTDINPRAIAMAELGAALSRAGRLHLRVADLLERAEDGAPWQLITFNAPIPGGDATSPGSSPDDEPYGEPDGGQAVADIPWYRYGDSDILARFWERVPELLAPDGEVLVHSVVPDGGFPAWLAGLPGEVVVVQYSPPGVEPAFGMSAWRPGGKPARRRSEHFLSAAVPHVPRRALGFGAG